MAGTTTKRKQQPLQPSSEGKPGQRSFSRRELYIDGPLESLHIITMVRPLERPPTNTSRERPLQISRRCIHRFKRCAAVNAKTRYIMATSELPNIQSSERRWSLDGGEPPRLTCRNRMEFTMSIPAKPTAGIDTRSQFSQ